MAMICKYGKPSLFITFTCNPKWPEIQDRIRGGQTYLDRPDLVARVFQEKSRQFYKDLTENVVFGRTIASTFVIEFQRGGLPHMHCLLTLCEEDEIKCP